MIIFQISVSPSTVEPALLPPAISPAVVEPSPACVLLDVLISVVSVQDEPFQDSTAFEIPGGPRYPPAAKEARDRCPRSRFHSQ